VFLASVNLYYFFKRFDQDALTIVNSFFYGHPVGRIYLPAYAFNTDERLAYYVKRRNVASYISDQLKNLW
jgi:hypothetical protein